MANFLVMKKTDSMAILGAFSNLKNAVECLVKMGANTNYDQVYRKMRHSDGGGFFDFDDFRITKISQNKIYQYQNGKLIKELTVHLDES